MVDNSHKSEWEKFERLWKSKSRSSDDVWGIRAQSCTRLLENLNNKKK